MNPKFIYEDGNYWLAVKQTSEVMLVHKDFALALSEKLNLDLFQKSDVLEVKNESQ